MQHVRQAALVTALALVMIASATPLVNASVAPKWSIGELADFAEVIVTGRVESVLGGWDQAVETIYTYVVVEVDEVFKGQVRPGRMVIKQLGGRVGAMGLHVHDQPTFVVGESVLLYLESRPRDGTLYTSALWQGKWTIEGERAVRLEPAGHRSAFPMDRQLLAEVRGLASRYSAAPVRVVNTMPADAVSAVAQPYQLQGPYRYFFNPPVDVQSGGQPGLAGGGIVEIQSSLAKWNAVGGSFQFVFGSTNGPARCTSQELNNNRVTISFNDPCGEISDSGATLALGGSYFTDDGATINGQFFSRATEGFVVNADGSAALSHFQQSGCFANVQLHELGHVLGLDHSSDTGAIMFPSLDPTCSSGAHNLGADDRNGLLFIYPPTGGGGGGGLTPPSAAPTGVNVVVNGTTSITVSFNAVNALLAANASAATMYRLDFRQTTGGPVVASLTVGSTSNVIPVPPGTAGTFNVTVTGVNSAGAGPSSAPVSFTIGGGGGGGGCGGPPASPVVSGSLISGTATVGWNSVPGATFYILSAGTNQGGSNLYATANIGPTTSVQATGLPPGFTAWVRVIAGNPCGQSAPTDFFLSGSGAPGPPAPTTASILFGTEPNACGCWAASISVRIDSTPVGSMSCSGTAGPFSVPPGAHTVEACDPEGCEVRNVNLSTGETITFAVGCS